jgi:hypothetical protein
MINVKEETKGHGEVVWGNKFSTIAGSTTSVTVGAKHTIEVAANNSLRFGMKNAFEFGPSFVYHCAPEFQKASKYADATASSFGRAQSSGFGQTMNWLNAKITFSDIKEHKFFIAKEGSTSMFTTNKQYSETGFTAGAGYGKIATAGYDSYCSAVKKTKWVMTGMTAIPVLVSLLQNLASGPGSSPDPGGKAVPQPWLKLNSNIGVAINIGATIGPAIGSLWAAFHAVAQREGFKNAIKPKAVIDMNKSLGLFIGTDHSGFMNGNANGLQMNKDGTSLGLSVALDKDGYPFSSVSEQRPGGKNELKFGMLKKHPISAMTLGKATGDYFLASHAPIMLLQSVPKAQSREDIAQTFSSRGISKGEMLLLAEKQVTVESPKINLTDSTAHTTISLQGGDKGADKRIELKAKKNNFESSVAVSDKAVRLQTGKQTKLAMEDEDFCVSIGRDTLIRMSKGTLILRTSQKSKMAFSASAISIMGGNLKVMS